MALATDARLIGKPRKCLSQLQSDGLIDTIHLNCRVRGLLEPRVATEGQRCSFWRDQCQLPPPADPRRSAIGVILLKPISVRRALIRATAFAGCAIALGAWWWLRLPGREPTVRGTAYSSFEVPDHLDESEFTQRLAKVGFVTVNNEDFDSLLNRGNHGHAFAPGKPAPDLKSLQTYRHIGNTDSITRIIGYDARARRVHYFRSQVYAREDAEGRLLGDVPDTIEEDLRK